MKRDETVDLIKGLGIFFVVLAHSGFPLSKEVYLFHMPVFLMASGYCYNLKNSQSPQTLATYAGKKLKSLYIPYLMFNALFILLYNQLIDWNIYTDNPAFSNPVEKRIWWQTWSKLNGAMHFEPSATQQLCGADWFVIVLFYITLLFAGVCYLTKFAKFPVLQHGLRIASAVIMLDLGFYLQKKDYFIDGYWAPAITGYSLYVLGFYLQKLPQGVHTVVRKGRWLFAVLGTAFFLLAKRYGSISLNANSFTSPLFLVICAVVGWYYLESLAYIFQGWAPMKKLLVLLSKSSLFILFLHFLSFKAVTAVQLLVYREPSYLLASFPIYRNEGLWWVAYTVVGLALPVLIKLLFDWIKGKLAPKTV